MGRLSDYKYKRGAITKTKLVTILIAVLAQRKLTKGKYWKSLIVKTQATWIGEYWKIVAKMVLMLIPIYTVPVVYNIRRNVL